MSIVVVVVVVVGVVVAVVFGVVVVVVQYISIQKISDFNVNLRFKNLTVLNSAFKLK